MAEEKERKIVGGKGEPPNDGRKWICADDAAAKLEVSRDQVTHLAKRYGWTTYRKPPCRTWILEQDFRIHFDLVKIRGRYFKRRRPKTWREEIFDVDEETARRVFWTVEQAALYMGVAVRTIQKWGQQGKIPIFNDGKAAPVGS